MLQFDAVWLFALLPLPLLVWWLAPPHKDPVEAVRAPMFHRVVALTGAAPSRGAVVLVRPWFRVLLLSLVWVAVIVALARPTWLGEPVTVTKSARDLLMIVDLSESMGVSDVASQTGQPISRLASVKAVLGEFIPKRKGDRLGLVFFGGAPYLQVPFTADVSVTAQLLDEAVVGMAGNQTMLGDAIGLAIRLFRSSEASSRVVILLTDGNDTGSFVPPLQASLMAKRENIVVHVVGFGDPASAGEQPLNEEVLTQIAKTTGGAYFFAADQKRLDAIYSQLDRLERIEFESRTYTPQRELFHLPLGLAVTIMMIFFAMLLIRGGPGRRRRRAG